MPKKFILVATFALFIILVSQVSFPARATETAVRAVLFFSPSCGHCEKVIQDDLPPLQQQYQDRLIIAKVDVSTPGGRQLYQAAIKQLNIPDDRLGVPTMVIGDEVLVGSVEIPTRFPALIESGLAAGGIQWPALTGLDPFTAGLEKSPVEENTSVNDASNPMLEKFMRDPLGNSLAVLLLLTMIFSVFVVAYQYVMGDPQRVKAWPNWVIPVAALAGIGISIYMTYVETTRTAAFCGPIGDCNTVQQSSYAMLFGIIPVGLLGLLGYAAILVLWLLQHYLSTAWRRLVWFSMWGMSVFGVLFSIYLTFLEPFVIGATCIWCLSSAIVMTILMWAITPMAIRLTGEVERSKALA
jgi:uncharacterized membrane protein